MQLKSGLLSIIIIIIIIIITIIIIIIIILLLLLLIFFPLLLLMSRAQCLRGVQREPTWPGGKALGWSAERRRFDSPLRLTLLLFTNYDL